MARAGVFIGVDSSGSLQRLKDAAAGARRMHEWALAQGMVDQTHAKLITDDRGAKVHPDQIYDAIKAIIDGPSVDQLILYFAGHGVNINRGEHWLLTEAPVRSSAAVNLSGSVELARYCGIRHVVIISDACRVAAEGLQAQNVRGVDVFPNDGTGDRARPVDQFFACYLGRTAAELKDPGTAAENYTALYTTVLLDALKGAREEVLDPSPTAGEECRYVKPRRLEAYLEVEIPRRVKEMRLEHIVNQNPDAIITSDESWLSRVVTPVGGVRKLRRVRVRGVEPPLASPPGPTTLRAITSDLVRSAMEAGRITWEQLRGVPSEGNTDTGILTGSVEQLARPFGPDHFESECGIKVRGNRIVDFFAPRAHGEILGQQRDILRITGLDHPAVSVLLRFEGGFGAVIPAIPGFLAGLSFENGELVDVAYEPSTNTSRWQLFEHRATELRLLRAVAASASANGRFRLEGPDSANLAQRMQYAKGIDPTLAVYAAYAYHDLQEIERIRHMSEFLQDDIGVTLFDLALLGRTLVDRPITPNDRTVPFVPLLSQGWALLGAHRIKLHPALAGIERTTTDSLWSLFDARGVNMLSAAMQSREVR